MNRETFEIVWPFVEEMMNKRSVGQRAHSHLYDLGIAFEPWSMMSDPYKPIAKVLLKELSLSEDECLRSMSEQVWNETEGLFDKEEYYTALCDLMKEWAE